MIRAFGSESENVGLFTSFAVKAKDHMKLLVQSLAWLVNSKWELTLVPE